MNNWQQYFALQGANSERTLSVADLADGFIAPIVDLALIKASGAEAANFLHKQLTNEVEHMGLREARLAGYCSPKGRLMATFLVWRNAESIFLQRPRSISAALQKRLQMFIMRSKVTLLDASDAQLTLGLGGHKAAADAT